MLHPELATLQADSTLCDLPTTNFWVGPETLGNRVTVEFDQHPDIPGVLILKNGNLLGMISREKFMEHLSKPFALEVFMRRPIEIMLGQMKDQPLELPATMSIDEAAGIALNRPGHEVYEPIIVRQPNGEVRLLSSITLLLAQSRLLALANEIINRQKDEAEEANKAKSRFLANMSHEIRTPLNGIIGMTEIVLDSQLATQQREHLELVRSSADWLLVVINDILDFSKIEADKIDLEAIEFDLRAMIDETLKPISHRAAGKGLVLSARIAPLVPTWLIGDPVRLRQIITNLVGNAIKFTDRGEIVVHVDTGERTDELQSLRISVSDTGIGIPPERVHSIFEAFEQADGSTTRKYGGTGLGLSISQRLVELMGGRIWVESVVGRGSTFKFDLRLPYRENYRGVTTPTAAAQGTLIGQPDDVRGLKVLLAEDNIVNQKLAVLLLEKREHQVTLVDDGQKAVAAYETGDFDIILMDVQMPTMDGFTAVAEIRQLEAFRGAHIPVIAMTAHAMKGDRERCLEAGMDGYVSKPIRAPELYAAIAELAPKSSSQSQQINRRADLAHSPLPPSSGNGDKNSHVIDWDEALANTGGDRDLMQTIIDVFLSESPRMIAEAREALAAKDAPRLRRAGHSIKGSCVYFAAPDAYNAALTLERLGEAGDLSSASEAIERLVQQITRLNPALTHFRQTSCNN